MHTCTKHNIIFFARNKAKLQIRIFEGWTSNAGRPIRWKSPAFSEEQPDRRFYRLVEGFVIWGCLSEVVLVSLALSEFCAVVFRPTEAERPAVVGLAGFLSPSALWVAVVGRLLGDVDAVRVAVWGRLVPAAARWAVVGRLDVDGVFPVGLVALLEPVLSEPALLLASPSEFELEVFAAFDAAFSLAVAVFLVPLLPDLPETVSFTSVTLALGSGYSTEDILPGLGERLLYVVTSENLEERPVSLLFLLTVLPRWLALVARDPPAFDFDDVVPLRPLPILAVIGLALTGLPLLADFMVVFLVWLPPPGTWLLWAFEVPTPDLGLGVVFLSAAGLSVPVFPSFALSCSFLSFFSFSSLSRRALWAMALAFHSRPIRNAISFGVSFPRFLFLRALFVNARKSCARNSSRVYSLTSLASSRMACLSWQ